MPKFDVVILGAGLSGCAVAALLAKSGKRVLIMDPASSPGGTASSVGLEGTRMSGWPACVHGFEEGGVWSSLLKDLGLESAGATDSTSYQVALPGRRITVSPEVGATLAELGREYPGEIDALKRFYEDVASLQMRVARSRIFSYLAHRRKAADYIRRYGFSAELLAFFSATSFAFLGSPVHDLSLAQLVRLVMEPPRQVQGRFDAIARGLCDYVTKRGGELRLNVSWPELHVQRSRLEGLRTADERIDVRTAVLNVPWRIRQRSLFSLVREEVIPVGMLNTVLVVDDYDRPDLSLLLSLDPAVPGETGGLGLRPLRALFPERVACQGTPEQEYLMTAVSRIVPFLAQFTEATIFRQCDERTLSALKTEALAHRPMSTVGTLPLLRMPVRTMYVLEDTAFGVVRQANAVIDLASRLTRGV